MNQIEAIAWDYDNIPFRSKLEAKWYATFQLMGYQVEYEPGAQETCIGTYLPDFLINGEKFVEIKPLRDEYPERDHDSIWRAVVVGYSTPTIIIFGEPRRFSPSNAADATRVHRSVTGSTVFCNQQKSGGCTHTTQASTTTGRFR